MAEKKFRIGVDLGGTNIKVGVVDENEVIINKKSAKTTMRCSFCRIEWPYHSK